MNLGSHGSLANQDGRERLCFSVRLGKHYIGAGLSCPGRVGHE